MDGKRPESYADTLVRSTVGFLPWQKVSFATTLEKTGKPAKTLAFSDIQRWLLTIDMLLTGKESVSGSGSEWRAISRTLGFRQTRFCRQVLALMSVCLTVWVFWVAHENRIATNVFPHP